MNRSTQENLKKSSKNENEYDWVDMLPTIAFSYRSSMNASTRLLPLEMILGHKPCVPVDIFMKYPTDKDLDRDLTTEEVATLEREYLDIRIKEMKKVKETMIGRAKVNIANVQIRQKRNYDKRFEMKEKFKRGDLVLLENQVNKNRKGGKRQNRFSGPYTILDISKAGNCTLKHNEGTVKKTKHPLAHLKQYHERNLVVESESEMEENGEDKEEVDDILDSFVKDERLEFVESLVTEENREKKLAKEEKLDCNWNFTEKDREKKFVKEEKLDCNWNIMGLVIKDKFKRKRKRRESTGQKKKVTYLDLSKCVASEEDTLPDINTEEKFTGTPITGARITGALNEKTEEMVTGAQIFRIEDDWIVTGAPSVTGACESNEDDNVTGAPVTGALDEDIIVTSTHVTGTLEENIPVTDTPFTGADWGDFRKTPGRIRKARR